MVSHDAQVNQQFGPTAAAYLSSPVHAQGEDLQRARELFEGSPTARVLDLGCGAGHLSFAIAPQVQSVTAYDLSPQMLAVVAHAAEERGLKNLSTRQGVAESLPFADASFDAACTRFSAHHWSDVPRALAEVRRVLAPGGRLLVIDMCAPESPLLDTHLQTVELLRDVSHVRDFKPSEWRRMLLGAGFDVRAERQWKLRMEFDSWTARMRTPADRKEVIRGLLLGAPAEVRSYYAVEPDASFTPDTMSLEAILVPA